MFAFTVLIVALVVVGFHFCVLLTWCLLIRIGCLVYDCGDVAGCVAVGVAVGVVADVMVVGCLCRLLLAIWFDIVLFGYW